MLATNYCLLATHSLPLHLITQQHIPIANKKLPPSNHRLRPGIISAPIWLIEPPVLLIALRRCFDQRDRAFAALAPAIQTPVGVGDRAFAQLVRIPDALAALHLQTGPTLPPRIRKSVNVIA